MQIENLFFFNSSDHHHQQRSFKEDTQPLPPRVQRRGVESQNNNGNDVEKSQIQNKTMDLNEKPWKNKHEYERRKVENWTFIFIIATTTDQSTQRKKQLCDGGLISINTIYALFNGGSDGYSEIGGGGNDGGSYRWWNPRLKRGKIGGEFQRKKIGSENHNMSLFVSFFYCIFIDLGMKRVDQNLVFLQTPYITTNSNERIWAWFFFLHNWLHFFNFIINFVFCF